MGIHVEQHGDVIVVRLAGRLDSFTSPKIDSQLRTLIVQHKKVVLNLNELEYISSAGIRLILSLSKQLEADQGTLVICCIQDSVLEVIKLTGFQQVLKIFNSEIESISYF